MTVLLREVVGDALRRARTSQGRTLREVSDAARVSLGYLSEVERGRKEASSELLHAICGALGIPMSRVLFEAGQQLVRAERIGTRVATKATIDASIDAGIKADTAAGIKATIDASTKVVIPPVTALAGV